jgi:hypothetical protein
MACEEKNLCYTTTATTTTTTTTTTAAAAAADIWRLLLLCSVSVIYKSSWLTNCSDNLK